MKTFQASQQNTHGSIALTLSVERGKLPCHDGALGGQDGAVRAVVDQVQLRQEGRVGDVEGVLEVTG